MDYLYLGSLGWTRANSKDAAEQKFISMVADPEFHIETASAAVFEIPEGIGEIIVDGDLWLCFHDTGETEFRQINPVEFVKIDCDTRTVESRKPARKPANGSVYRI